MLSSKLPTPLAKQVTDMLVKGIMLLACLLAISLFMMPVLHKTPSIVVAKNKVIARSVANRE